LSRRLSFAWLSAAVTAVVCCAVASAGALPRVETPADRAGWRSLLHWPASCERSWRNSGGQGAGIETWRTRPGVRLVAVDCFTGAYQGVAMLYLVGPHAAVKGPLRLRIYVDRGNGPQVRTATTILGNLSFVPRTGRLTVFDKARGLGDCGIYSVFHLRGGVFVPVEVRAKTACDGRPPFDPRRWPKLPLP
jgi:hypothetical protein